MNQHAKKIKDKSIENPTKSEDEWNKFILKKSKNYFLELECKKEYNKTIIYL